MRLVFPSPLLPLMQLTFGEKDSSWNAIFRKSCTTIFFKVGMALSFLIANICKNTIFFTKFAVCYARQGTETII